MKKEEKKAVQNKDFMSILYNFSKNIHKYARNYFSIPVEVNIKDCDFTNIEKDSILSINLTIKKK